MLACRGLPIDTSLLKTTGWACEHLGVQVSLGCVEGRNGAEFSLGPSTQLGTLIEGSG